ncbi:MAG TPA: cellulase family glycosylhydrolase, partial [Acidimicrobiales bacterium]|nr:cellulase family glycosylhydrolase [Acidimicrobiales bacterium]
AWLANLKSIGVNSIRIEVNWAWISDAGPGTFDWSQIDQEVASIEAAGMSIDMIVMGAPSWAALAGESSSDVAQPADPAAFGSFAAAVAQRYAPQGVQDYEIWNEPNSTDFWLPAPNPAAYVQVLQAAYADIKAVDPSAFVIAGGLAPEANQDGNIDEVTFLQDMYADGAQGYFDALGDHPYSYPALPDSYEEWSGWSKMNATPTSLRSVMTANGDSSKPIWITEVGAPTGGPDSVGIDGQAEELTQAIDNAKTTPWIGGIYIYTYEDSGGDPTTDEDWFGLLNADGSPKPAWSAVASAIG